MLIVWCVPFQTTKNFFLSLHKKAYVSLFTMLRFIFSLKIRFSDLCMPSCTDVLYFFKIIHIGHTFFSIDLSFSNNGFYGMDKYNSFGHLHYFYFFDIINNTERDMFVHIPQLMCGHIPWM